MKLFLFFNVQKKVNMNRLKYLLAAFVVAILTLSIYSCVQEDVDETKSAINLFDSDVQTRTLVDDVNNNIYYYHYDGLIFAKDKVLLNPKPSIYSIVNKFNTSFSNYANVIIDSLQIENIVVNKGNLESIVRINIDQLNSITGLSETRKNKINELKNFIFNLKLTNTYRSEIVLKISTESDLEIQSGYTLLLSSYDFWINEILDNDDDVQAIQLDAAGYIIGWAHAVYEDIASGNLNESGQYRRMRAGAACGLACSVGKWF
jgi:hypothetical protein